MPSALIPTNRPLVSVVRIKHIGAPSGSGSSRIFAHRMLVALCASNIRSTPLKFPAPTTDRDRTVSRRSEPSSRTALIGEQPSLFPKAGPLGLVRTKGLYAETDSLPARVPSRSATLVKMKLPGGDRAIVDIAKLRDYSLSPAHPRGRHKARLFASVLGLTQEDAEFLREQLLKSRARRQRNPHPSRRIR